MKSKDKEYQRIHKWLNYHYKKPIKCPCCKETNKRIEWALIKGKEHCKNIDSYKPLCTKCHREYDLKGRDLTQEHKENISKSKKGVSIGVGKILTEEHKKAISNGMPKKINNEDMIKEKIAGVGYDTESHRAKDEVYNSLPGCCQYDRP